MVRITPERPADCQAIRAVVTAAFETADEADLVDALRASDAFVPGLSLVAHEDGAVLGHVLLSGVAVERAPETRALALAPVAVAPRFQGRGIGTDLVRAGLDAARDLDYDLVFLHGPPAFYRRFGFEPAAPAGFENPLSLPDDDFQVRELAAGAVENADGPLRYPARFVAT